MSNDNLLYFPGIKEDSAVFANLQARMRELQADLILEFDQFLAKKQAQTSLNVDCYRPDLDIEFVLSKLAALQAGLEFTMKTVVERIKSEQR